MSVPSVTRHVSITVWSSRTEGWWSSLLSLTAFWIFSGNTSEVEEVWPLNMTTTTSYLNPRKGDRTSVYLQKWIKIEIKKNNIVFWMYLVHFAPAGLAESFSDAPGGNSGQARVSKTPEELRRDCQLFGHGWESHVSVRWISLFFCIYLHWRWIKTFKKKKRKKFVAIRAGKSLDWGCIQN